MQHSTEQRPVSRIGARNYDGFHFCRNGAPEGGLALAFRGSPLFSVHGKEVDVFVENAMMRECCLRYPAFSRIYWRSP